MTVADRIVERRGLTGYTLALNYLPLAQLCAGAAVICDADNVARLKPSSGRWLGFIFCRRWSAV